jgi:uncharacterized protein (DUF427 family)
VTLTSGRGPLTADPAGRFVPPLDGRFVYVEPFRRCVQATRDGRTVVDSERVVLVHRPGRPPVYAFPAGDVRDVDTVPTSELDGYVEVAWDAADAWLEEGQQVFLHPRNPFHRVDCLRTNRRLRVEMAGVTVVDTRDTLVLYETSLEPKLYVDRSDLRGAQLVASATRTYCPYKGTATYWSAVVGDVRVDDVAWSYEDPLPESAAIKGLLSFEPARATIEHDVPPPAI